MICEYGLICTKCGQKFSTHCEYDDLADRIKDNKCTECGAELRRDYSLGGIKFNGEGFTRRIG